MVSGYAYLGFICLDHNCFSIIIQYVLTKICIFAYKITISYRSSRATIKIINFLYDIVSRNAVILSTYNFEILANVMLFSGNRIVFAGNENNLVMRDARYTKTLKNVMMHHYQLRSAG